MSVSQHQIDPPDNSVPRLRKFEVLIPCNFFLKKARSGMLSLSSGSHGPRYLARRAALPGYDTLPIWQTLLLESEL